MDIAALILALIAFALFVWERHLTGALLTAAFIAQFVALTGTTITAR